MEHIQNQNSTRGLSSLAVSRWEATPRLSSYDNDVIMALGVSTFALQLCLALLVMRRCVNLDKKARRALEHPQTLQKVQIDPSSCHPDVCKQTPNPRHDNCLLSAAEEGSYTGATGKNCLFGPSVPWDLVQY